MIVKEAVLKLGDLQTLHDTMMSEKFPWFYHPHQASVKDSSYFYHPFYWSHNIQSDDPKLQHKTAIFYVNSNNGYTEFQIGRKRKVVKSKSNHIVMFDSAIKHRAVSQTNSDRRIVINLNYY